MQQETAVRGLMRDRAKLLAYLVVIVRDRHVAEDLFQDVVAVALEKHAEIQDAGHLLAWARATARNKALEALRRRSRHPLVLDASALDRLDAEWARLDARDTETELDHLRDCLDRLPPRARRVVDLKFVRGLAGREIAGAIGAQVGSVYVALSRAYRTLQECIEAKRARLGGSDA